MNKKVKFIKIAKKGSKEKENDMRKRIRRLMGILNTLDSGKVVSCRELAKEFDVSMRTIQRDLDILQNDFSIVSPAHGKYAFMEGYTLKQCKLNPEEASLMAFFHEMASSLGGNIKQAYESLYKKFVHTEYDSAFYAKLPCGVKLDKNLPFVGELEQAIDEFRQVEICYLIHGKDKCFRLDPLKIIFFEGFWYLLAQLDGKDWVLKFRLDKIKDASVLDAYFDPPENLDAMLAQSTNVWFNEKRDKKVVLKISKYAAPYFKKKTYFPLQKIKKENKDGSLILETIVCDYMEVLPVVKAWIPEITIEEPTELKKALKDILIEFTQDKLGF